MKCFICGREARIREFKNRWICDRCFSRKIEKRVRRTIRVGEMFSRGDCIAARNPLCRFLLERILKDLRVRFCNKGKKVLADSLDDELNDFLSSMFSNKKAKRDEGVKILKNVKDDELIEFARINKLRFKALKKDKRIKEFLDRLDSKYPNAKFNLYKNVVMLNKLTK